VFQPEALLAVGSVRLAIYAVIGIAGRAHCGLVIDERAWSQWSAGLIVAAALLPPMLRPVVLRAKREPDRAAGAG
jgi:uncharacterized protein involved in response to NO